MAPSKTDGLTIVTDPRQIGHVTLIFEPNSKYPWLMPLLSEQYETNINGFNLVENRFADPEDTDTIYKDADDTPNFFAVDPEIIEVKILSSIAENTDDTSYQYEDSTDVAPDGPEVERMRNDLLHSLFTNNIKVSTSKGNYKSRLADADDLVLVVDAAAKKKGNVIALYVSFPGVHPRVSKMNFNPADLTHLTTNFDDCYQEDEPFSGSEERSASTMNLNCNAIVTAIRETAETFKNIKPHAPIDTHSAYVHWNYDILPTDVKTQFLIKQRSTTIQTSTSLVPYTYEIEVTSPLIQILTFQQRINKM